MMYVKPILRAVVLACAAATLALEAPAANAFRVTPYVQHPKPDAMTVKFLTTENSEATVSWWPQGNTGAMQSETVSPRLAEELQYYGDSHAKQYLPEMTPWQYRYRIEGLQPDTVYEYRVELAGGASYAKHFRTAPAANRPIRFVCYSDCETEPDSNGTAVTWDNYAQDNDANPSATTRKYLVDQTVGYASNICTMVSRQPDFFVIAGDLAQTGSKQTHWDEFWRHNAGALNDPAGSIPILAALGNHEYSSYTATAGDTAQPGEQGALKFLSYFEFEPNGAAVDADQQQRFHRVDYGPVAMIFIDPNNGPDNEPPMGTAWSWAWEYSHPHPLDTNAQLYEHRIDGGVDKSSRVPQFQEGSAQYRWLEEQLADAQTNKLFTFLVCHQCPFSAGYHGRASGEKGRGTEGENLSGAPTRCLTNLVFKYGVDGWICGHDEMYEHSQVQGEETLPDGTKRPMTLNVWDVGIGGDGLRGCRITEEPNPYEVFRAHVDSPEVYDNGNWQTGTLVSGGKHYGHLEVNVDQNAEGLWTATLTPVYNFVSKNAQTGEIFMERRTYPDEVVVTNLDVKAAPPEPPTGLSSASYVQDGLVHQWDGIENAGVGRSDTTASVWVDLKGDADLTLKDANSQFTGNALKRTSKNYAFAKAGKSLPGLKTIEVTFRRDAYQQFGIVVTPEGTTSNYRGAITMKNDDIGSIYNGFHASYEATHGDFVTVALYADIAKCETNLYVDGVAMPSTSASETWMSGMLTDFTLGGRWDNSGANCFSGEIFACRLYDRYLSSEELAANAMVDVLRFLPPPTLAVVASVGGTVSDAPTSVAFGDMVTVTATPDEGATFASWQSDNANVDTTGAGATFTFKMPKESVTLTALFAPEFHVAVDGADDAPGTEDAPMSLAAALVAERPYSASRIVLAPGTYELANQISLSNAVQLVGATGNPADVVLKRVVSGNHRIVYLNNAQACVSGVTLANGRVSGNWVYGGGCYFDANGGIVTNCVIASCYGGGKWGGGAGAYLNSKAAVLTHCVITNCSSVRQGDTGDRSGTAARIKAGFVSNSLIARNAGSTDKYPVTVLLEGADAKLLNCSVVNNTMTGAESVGGVYASAGTVRNCVIAGNTANGTGATANVWDGTAGKFSNCVADQYDPINATCRSGVVGLADAANGDWHLTGGSLCRDAGADDPQQSPGDLDGNPRVQGEAVDVGCYEFDESAFTASFIPSVTTGFAPLDVTFTATVTGADEGDELSYAWYLNGAEDPVVTTVPNYAVALATGYCSMKLVVTDVTSGKAAEPYELVDVVKVGPRTLYVVSGNEGTPPYESWETAAGDIQTAVDEALPGAEVVVSNGLYRLTSKVLVEKAVSLHGVTGRPEDVVLNGGGNAASRSGGVRLLELNAGADVTVYAMSFECGSSDSGCVYVHDNGGTVSNVVIRNCGTDAKFSSGGGFCLSGPAALLTHAVVTNCWSKGGQSDGCSAHGTAGNVTDGARIEHSLIAKNSSDMRNSSYRGCGQCTLVLGENSTARFCTVVDNVATNVAGINLSSGTARFEHCLIAGNRSAFGAEEPRWNVWGAYDLSAGGGSYGQQYTAMSNEWAKVTAEYADAHVTCCASDVLRISVDSVTDAASRLVKFQPGGRYRPFTGGVAMDAVEPAGVLDMPAIDVYGNPRLHNSKYDIGAVESQRDGGLRMFVK